MGREQQRAAMRQMREGLIDELEQLYRRAFDRLSDHDLGEGAIARLTQLLLRSREAAITPLQEQIEAPLITSPAGTSATSTPATAAEPTSRTTA